MFLTRIKLRCILTGLCLVAASLAQALVLPYSGSGTIAHDNEKVQVDFVLAGASRVTAFTTSYANGGFDTVLSLFDETGLLITPGSYWDNDGPVSIGNTGFRSDAYFAGMLNAGSYKVVLTQGDNSALGAFLSDGFKRDDDGAPDFNRDFSGPQFDLQFDSQHPSMCVEVGGSQRSCDWALTITTDPIATQAPAPGGLALLGIGLAGMLPVRRRARP